MLQAVFSIFFPFSSSVERKALPRVRAASLSNDLDLHAYSKSDGFLEVTTCTRAFRPLLSLQESRRTDRKLEVGVCVAAQCFMQLLEDSLFPIDCTASERRECRLNGLFWWLQLFSDRWLSSMLCAVHNFLFWAP